MIKEFYAVQFKCGSYWGYSGTPTNQIQKATFYAKRKSINFDFIAKKEKDKGWNRVKPKIIKIRIEVVEDGI